MVNDNPHIFVDTSFFKALVDPHDDFHKEAEALTSTFASQKVELVTSNYILDETFTLIRVKKGLTKALELRDTLKNRDLQVKIIRIGAADDASAWKWFTKPWKGLSFTDCTSFALMKRLGLTRVATFDEHFRKAGFGVE